MADRWSEPSGSLGTNRFRVWPLGTDSYSHADMASNWDKLDAILGVPSTGVWPPDGGLYGAITTAKAAAVPLGALFPFYRPDISVSLPSDAVVADGSTLNDTQHDFGTGDVTIPDLRNRFILGADPGKDVGESAADAGSVGADAASGAPGPQATGGTNAVVLTKDQIPSHTHSGSVTGWSPVTMDWYFQQSTLAAQAVAPVWIDGRDEAIAQCGYPGCPVYPERTAPIYPASENFNSVGWGTGVNHSTGAGGWRGGQHRHDISSLAAEGGGAVHENRPRYVGLIWLIKVKN